MTTSTQTGAVLTVGAGQQYATIQDAVGAAQSGDTIDVQAGTYTNDFIDTDKSLTLQAVGGVVKMVETQSPPDGKAMITEGSSGGTFSINGFDVSGVSVSDGNGAAVRYQGGDLTLNNDNFHNNQDGILAGADPNGNITINNSEFAYNGSGDGYTHNIYVGDVKQLTIENSYIHDANVGHEIKSRAENTTITGSRILDNNSTASYSIDLPNGGNANVSNDIIQQGANSQNPVIISYGEEGSLNAGTTVQINGNTIVNDASGSAVGIKNATSASITAQGNSVYGLTSSELGSGSVSASGTNYLSSQPTLDTTSSWAPSTGTSTPTPTPVATTTPDPTPTPTPGATTTPDPTPTPTPVATTTPDPTSTPTPVATTTPDPTPTPTPGATTTPDPTPTPTPVATTTPDPTPTPTPGATTTPDPTPTTTVSLDDSNPTVTVDNVNVVASPGDHMLFLQGTGDTVNLSGGQESVFSSKGGNQITTGAGNDTIGTVGSGSVINAGGGANLLDDSGSANTLVLDATGQDTIFGNVLQNGDTFDLRSALGSTSWDGTEGTLANYLSVTNSANGSVITLHPTGSTAGSAIATLPGTQLTMGTLLQHAVT